MGSNPEQGLINLLDSHRACLSTGGYTLVLL